MPVTDADVRAAYVEARCNVIDALNADPLIHDAEFIHGKDAIFCFVETPIGRAAIYFSGMVYGGLMSDRQRADAEAHAEVLAERIRVRENGGDQPQ